MRAAQAEQVWLAQEIIVAEDATSDPRLEALGMNHMAKAAGIQNTVVLPLSAVGGPLGYLQVGDKQNGQRFDAEDLDVSITAVKLGYILKALTKSKLKHIGGATIYPLYPDRQEYTKRNIQYLKEKWAGKL